MLYFCPSMRDLFPTMRSRFMSRIFVSLALTAWCFSVGEGLRLTPFPAPHDVQFDQESSSSIDLSSQSAHYKYGPLDIPTQQQKRNKRQVVESFGFVSSYSHSLFTGHFPSAEQRSTTGLSTLVVALPSGRGPPFVA